MRAKRIDAPPEDRFRPKVLIGGHDECWLWQAAVRRDGYGVFGLPGRRLVSAHRFAYTLAYGEFDERLSVLHRCDVRLCVNPAHLFLGTQKDNISDMVAKQRHWAHMGKQVAVRGEANGSSRLREDDIREIRRRHRSGESLSSLGRAFSVSHVAIRLVIIGRTWSHVPESADASSTMAARLTDGEATADADDHGRERAGARGLARG